MQYANPVRSLFVGPSNKFFRIAIGISLLATMLSGIFSPQLQASAEDSSEFASDLTGDMGSWQQYTDPTYGLTLRFPEGWQFEEDPTFAMSTSSSSAILSRRVAFGDYNNLLSGITEPADSCRVDLLIGLGPNVAVNSSALLLSPQTSGRSVELSSDSIPKLVITASMSRGGGSYREVYWGYKQGVVGVVMQAASEASNSRCESQFTAIEASLSVNSLGEPGNADMFDALSAAAQHQATAMPRVLELPYRGNIHIQQGWKYTYSDAPHNGIDYMQGGNRGEEFQVLAAAAGNAKYIGFKNGWGNTVVVEHIIDGVRYYTLYAHLASWSVPTAPDYKPVYVGEPIAVAGMTGSGSGNVNHLHLEVSLNMWGTPNTRYDPYDLYNYAKYYPGGGSYKGSGPNHSWKYEDSGLDGITLYEHPNYEGAQLHLTSSDLDLCDNPLDPTLGTIECFTAPSWTNNASSIRVAPGWRARLHKHNQKDADKWGDDELQALYCNQDIPDFRTMTFPDGLTLDNEVSRIYVTKCLAAGSNTLTAAGIQSSACDPASPPPANWDGAEFRSVETKRNGTGLAVTWTVHNAGTTTWGQGYTLAFRHGEQMGAPDSVAVPATPPGGDARITVGFTLPSQPGTYTSYWLLRAPNGVYFGPELSSNGTVDKPNAPPPADKPANLVCLNCLATMAPGQSYRPTVRITIGEGQLLPDRGDMLRNTDGNRYGAWEHVAVDRMVGPGQSIDLTFYEDNPLRAPDTPGVYESKWRIWRDGGWYGPELTIRFEVKAGGGNRAPNSPTLTSPHDWAVYTGNGGIVLSAQQNGDPDGDPITHYYFEISGQQTANSGWITSSSWSPQGLGYYGYQWRVKVRDSQGIESGWSSQTWNFSVQTNEPQIYEFYATQCRAAWDNGNTEKLCFCARTNAGTIRLQANSATDGSDRGEWEVINELGSSSWSCSSDSDRPPTWEQLRFEAGRHLIRLYARRDGGWAAAANRDIYVDLPAERKPNSPRVTLPQWESYTNSRTVLFDWNDSLRTSSYRLQVATDEALTNLLIDRTFPAGTSQYQHTFDADYPYLYGRVTAFGPYGTNTAGLRVKIDRTTPQSAAAALPPVTFDTKFNVQWGGSDSQSGLNWYHVQVRDGNRADSVWQDWLVNTTKTAEVFNGLTGHTYYFRVRAMDKIGNWEAWPAGDGDTYTLVDPAAAPQVPWWNGGYQWKYNLVVLNNDADAVPPDFPVHIHLDANTTPTAAEIYGASQSSTKGDDVRIVVNNQIELNRIVSGFGPTAIDIWFPVQAWIGASQADSTSYQLYVGNAAAAGPPKDANAVYVPRVDGNTMGLWRLQEGSGVSVADSSGRSHWGSFANSGWVQGYTGIAGSFNGSNSTVTIGNHSDFNNLAAFTVEAWIYITRGSWGKIVLKGVNGAEQFFLGTNGDTGLEFSVGADGGNRVVSGGGRLELNRWYHIAGVHDGGSNQWLFIDGVNVGHISNSRAAIPRDTAVYIGNVPYWGGMAFAGYIQHVRISNVARLDFPYAKINLPPTVAVGSKTAPPIPGTADLAMGGIRVYPDNKGGFVAEVLVRNVGSKDTQSGFYTDLYIDHAPAGPGDYSGSVQFWVNSPIAAGTAVTLTAPLPAAKALVAAQDPGAVPPEVAAANSAPAEVTTMLYLQTDSAGAVRDTDRSNNVTSGYQVCTAAADSFEPDDSETTAKTLALSTPQTHNFNSAADGDWLRFRTTAGVTYTFSTGDLGLAADTYLHLYSADRSMLLASNDDYGDRLASSITWKAPAGDDYYLLVRNWNPNVQGCGTSYAVRVDLASALVPVPTAAFTAGSRQGIAPFAVQLMDKSQGQVTAWQWSFGDGQTSAEQHPVHTYLLPGSYTVGLTVTGPGGTHSRSEPGYIVVNAPIGEPLPTYLYLPRIVK